jgi:hypothetical protein
MAKKVEERLVFWDGVPSGSTFTLQVTPGDYAVTADVSLQTAQSPAPTLFKLGAENLVDKPFQVPIGKGTVLQVQLRLTYIFPKATTGTVRARVVRPDGKNHQQPFECEYSGALGSASPEDQVDLIVAGGQAGGGQ